MNHIYLAVLNNTTLLTDEEVAPVVDAVQKQIDLDFGPAWNIYASLQAIKQGEKADARSWTIALRDDCDEAGALGYHMDESDPWGIVGVGVAQKENIPWSSVLSHEVLELMADPWATLCCQAGARTYAYEICDPVEGEPYEIDGIKVENFILPSWFRTGSQGPWDHCGRLTSPLSLLPGGYDSFTTIGTWTQENNARVRASKLEANRLTRRGRRRGGRS